MRTYACIDENVVVDVLSLDEDAFLSKSKIHALLIDITDIIPTPEIGWALSGNKLIPAPEIIQDNDVRRFYQQSAQRKFGQQLIVEAIDLIGARNLKLHEENIPADVALLASQMASIKLLLEGGALKTSKTLCAAISPLFPLHSDILSVIISKIDNFLINNNWQ